MLFGLSRRSSQWQEQIEQMDPETEYFEIARILISREFCLDILMATEIAQLRTFTIPSISKLLHRTGQYECEGEKRLDDTKAILVEMTLDSVHSSKGKEMAEHLNRIHSFYNISNDDYLYTLSTFIFDPFLWIEKYGWRKLTDKEKRAVYLYYKDMGEAMNIQHIPPSFDAFWEWRNQYEANHQAYAETNTFVALGLLHAIGSQFPKWMTPWLITFTCSLIDDHKFLGALGFSFPSSFVHRFIQGAMSLRKVMLKYVTIWDKNNFLDSWLFNHYPTYPDGYENSQLGPTKLVNKMNQEKEAFMARGCPHHRKKAS